MSVTIPHTFADGGLIVASQFNDNFAAVKAAVDPVIVSTDTLTKQVNWVTPEMFGAVDGVNDEVQIQAAIDYAKANALIVVLGPKTYKISTTLSVKATIRGYGQHLTFISPQASFPAMDVYGDYNINGEFGDFHINYSGLGATNIDSNAIAMRFMHYSASANDQIQHTVFKNIRATTPYRGIVYDAGPGSSKGQFWNVTFERIYINSPQNFAFYFNCSGGTLGVYFRDMVVESAYNFHPFYTTNPAIWSYSKGFYMNNASTVSIENICLSRIQNVSQGDILTFTAVHQLSLNNIQIEQANYTNTNAGIAFGNVQAVVYNGVMQNATFTTSITPYIAIYASGTQNIIINNIFEFGTITNSTYRRFVNLIAGMPSVRLVVNDGRILPSACIFGEPSYYAFAKFINSNPGETIINKANRLLVPENTSTTILSLPAFGLSGDAVSGLYVVTGVKSSDSSKGFVDLVLIGATHTTYYVTTVSSNDINGYTFTRTYSYASFAFNITIQSGSGNTWVGVGGINQPSPFTV